LSQILATRAIAIVVRIARRPQSPRKIDDDAAETRNLDLSAGQETVKIVSSLHASAYMYICSDKTKT
jgi:hypothetical protein